MSLRKCWNWFSPSSLKPATQSRPRVKMPQNGHSKYFFACHFNGVSSTSETYLLQKQILLCICLSYLLYVILQRIGQPSMWLSMSLFSFTAKQKDVSWPIPIICWVMSSFCLFTVSSVRFQVQELKSFQAFWELFPCFLCKMFCFSPKTNQRCLWHIYLIPSFERFLLGVYETCPGKSVRI